MIEKLKKLQRMSANEIAHRLRERVRRNVDRVRSHPDDTELGDLIRNNGSSLKSYLQNVVARRFYPSTHDREALGDFLLDHFPGCLEAAITEADRLCEHRIDLFASQNLFLGASIDWHCDPVTPFVWPRRYWADYDLIGAADADPKIIHELNRHQHLPRLAKAFFLTGREAYASEALEQIESWIEQNPVGYGVNWQSSLEIALRSMAWIWTIVLLRDSQSLDERRLRRITRSLLLQLDHVHRYPSVYTSPNTHLIGEATALFMAGVIFRDLPRARKWREFGMKTLIDAMDRQVSNDGVYRELSTYYHCYAADFFLHALVLARQNQIGFPQAAWERLSRMIEFVMHMTRPDGTIPLIGDDDGGRVLALAARDYRSFCDGISSGAVLFGRSDFKHQALSFHEESLWLLGREAWPVFDALSAQPPQESDRAFDTGQVVERSSWDSNATHLTFDRGGLGFDSGGHSHADALSVNVFTGGHEFLVDAGTSTYNCLPEWRRYFRSSAAHNCVLVDGRGQCEPGGTFQWKTRAPVRGGNDVTLADISCVEGEVDINGVTHRRRLVHLRPDYWIILDELRGRGAHEFDFLYHFAPEAQLTLTSDESRGEVDCRARVGRAGLQLSMYSSEAVRIEAVCGVSNPIQGWTSRGYGERHASPTVQASVQGVVPVSMMSFLFPGNDAIQARRFRANSNHTIAVAVRSGPYEDVAVITVEDGDLHFIDYSMRGEFFWLRLENGKLSRLFAVNAYSFAFAGEPIFESKTVVPYIHAHLWDNGILIERGEQEGKVYVRDLRDRQFQRH